MEIQNPNENSGFNSNLNPKIFLPKKSTFQVKELQKQSEMFYKKYCS